MTTSFVHRPRCELCGSDRYQTLLVKPFTDPAIWDFLARYYEGRVEREYLMDAIYEICKCQTCGFIWQAYILNDELMGKLYDIWIAAETSLKKKGGEIPSGYRRQTELISQLSPGKSPSDIRVLDFGMGWGYWCMAAMSWGYQTVGLEVSDKRIRFAREQGVQVVTQLDDLHDQQFDFINADQVFEHISQPLETLKALVKHLKPGGVMRVGVPDGKGIERQLAQPDWHASKNAIHPLEHINCFQHHTLIRLGASAGLTPISQPVMLTFRYGWRSLMNTVTARYYRHFFDTVLYLRNTDGAQT